MSEVSKRESDSGSVQVAVSTPQFVSVLHPNVESVTW